MNCIAVKSIEKTTSAPCITSAGVAPIAAAARTAFVYLAGDQFQTVTGHLRARFSAIDEPIVASPRTPTFILNEFVSSRAPFEDNDRLYEVFRS